MNPQSVRRLKSVAELANAKVTTVTSTGWELGRTAPFIPFVDENTWIAFTTHPKATRRMHFVKAASSSQVRRALTYHGHDPKEYTIRQLNAEYLHELVDIHVTRKHRSTRSRRD